MSKIKTFLDKIKYFFSKESCYGEMVKRGCAYDFKCCGLSGGSRNTNYLNESCVGCKYLDLSWGGSNE